MVNCWQGSAEQSTAWRLTRLSFGTDRRHNQDMTYELAFIGAGNMAEAIARGIFSAGVLAPPRVVAADPSDQRLALFRNLGTAVSASNAEAAAGARTVVLSVKPQMLPAVLAEVGPVIAPTQLVVSIVAGVSTAKIESALPAGARVIRAMPNTPMLVGMGATALCRGACATPDDLAAARRLFECASAVVDVQEAVMNTVTAVSGSGPAYFFYLVEHMIAAGTRLGLSPEQARTLVYRTASGAARLLETSPEAPAELRRRVTSPGGTTQAAIELMESRGVGNAIQQAVEAAEKRGRQLGG